MKKILENLKEGDIFIKISEGESEWSDSTIEHNSITIMKILKKVKKRDEKEDFFIYEMRCFSNYNIDNNPDKWELVDTVSTDEPSLQSISFIEYEISETCKDEVDNCSFVMKDDANEIWEEAMKKHYPRISNAVVLNPKELEDFMNSIAGDNWRICLGSLGYAF
jgi:hypothetical protein